MMMTSLDQRFEHLIMGAVQSPEASTSDQHLPPLYDRYVPGLDQRGSVPRADRQRQLPRLRATEMITSPS
jgi:hypothetical protein